MSDKDLQNPCPSLPGDVKTTGSAPVAEIVRWKTFTGHDGWDIKIFDKDIAHGTKLYAASASPAASAPKPVSELESTEDYLARRDGIAACSLPDAHELWAAAQLLPSEGIEDGVRRIASLLAVSMGEKS